MLALTLWPEWAYAIGYLGKDIENRTRSQPSVHHIEGIADRAESEIVAVATVAEFVGGSSSPWFVGPIGWRLEDVRTLRTPVACREAQGLWLVPQDVLLRVNAQVAP